jgi:hypothetical protein
LHSLPHAAVNLPMHSVRTHLEPFGTAAVESRKIKTGSTTDYSFGKAGVRLSYPIATGPGLIVLRAGLEYSREDIAARIPVSGLMIDSLQSYSTRAIRFGVLWAAAVEGLALEGLVETVLGDGRTLQKFGPPAYFNPQDIRSRAEGLSAKVEGALKVVIDVPLEAKLEGILRVQRRLNGALMPVEQMQLLQSLSIVPFNPETVQGHSGYLARLEASRRWAFTQQGFAWSLKPYVFAAVGGIRQDTVGTLVTGASRVTGVSFGGGVNIEAAGLMTTLEGFVINTSDRNKDQFGVNLRMGSKF